MEACGRTVSACTVTVIQHMHIRSTKDLAYHDVSDRLALERNCRMCVFLFGYGLLANQESL